MELKLTYSCYNCGYKIFNDSEKQPTFNYAKDNNKYDDCHFEPICPKCSYEMSRE